jgi:hypothetical protein
MIGYLARFQIRCLQFSVLFGMIFNNFRTSPQSENNAGTEGSTKLIQSHEVVASECILFTQTSTGSQGPGSLAVLVFLGFAWLVCFLKSALRFPAPGDAIFTCVQHAFRTCLPNSGIDPRWQRKFPDHAGDEAG